VLETNVQIVRSLQGDLFCVLPELTVENKRQRMTFAEWSQKNEVSFNNVWFSDEGHSHFDGEVNKQNVQAIFGCHRILVSFMRRCIVHQELQCGSPSQVMDR
jgi:hypothetical protein